MPVRLSLPRAKKQQTAYASSDSEVAKLRKLGFRLSARRRYGKHKLAKLNKKWELFEQEVRLFFEFGLKLSDVMGGAGIFLGDYQIDAMGGIDRTLLIVECKSKDRRGQKPLHGIIRSFRDSRRSLIHAAKQRFGLKYDTFVFIIALRDIAPSERDVEYAKQNKILLWTDAYLDSLRALYLTIGDRTRFYVLKELGLKIPFVAGRTKYLAFPALASKSREATLFSLLMPARDLLDISYVLRVESGQERAYQRFLDKKRLVNIARYIEGGQTFKNNVVLALDGSSSFRPYRAAKRLHNGQLGELRIPRRYASAWIIDGQHRVYGYARTDERLWEALLPVTALQTKNRAEEARIFIDINKNQKPVDPNLIWALLHRLNPHSQEGRISDLVRRLSREVGPFKNQIYIPGHGKRSSFDLFHANMCDTIADHLVEGKKSGFPLIMSDDRSETIQQSAIDKTIRILGRYFDWLSKVANESGARKWINDFFLTNNGFNVMTRTLVQILRYTNGSFTKAKAQSLFGRMLSIFLKQNEGQIDNMRKRTSSEGTRDDEAFRFIRALAAGNDDFATAYLVAHQAQQPEAYQVMKQIEQTLREFVSRRLTTVDARWWRTRVPGPIRADAEERKRGRELVPWLAPGDYDVLYFLNFADYKTIILRNDNWYQAFEKTFRDKEWLSYTMRVLEALRNDTMHTRDLTDQEMMLLKITSEQLNRAIEGGRLSTESREELTELAASL